ncbi:MAG: DUF420 domain-containing protein [Bacteroidota bacterium]
MENSNKYKTLITILSVALPVVVVILFQVKVEGYDLRFLPRIYAGINALTAVLLIAAVVQIKKGNKEVHRKLMIVNLVLSALFLLMYVAYHITSDPAQYGGAYRGVYLFILISHIALSVVVTPLILFTLSRALAGEFDRHRALARITFPVWLYVAVTGVIVYLMISPYYQQ